MEATPKQSRQMMKIADIGILTYADVCSRMLTYAHVAADDEDRRHEYPHVSSRILTYANVAADDEDR